MYAHIINNKCDLQCKKGYTSFDKYGYRDGCFKCSDHCLSCNSTTSRCTLCDAGYGLTESGKCLPCEQKPCESCLSNYKNCSRYATPGPPASGTYSFVNSWRLTAGCKGTHLAYSPKWCTSSDLDAPYTQQVVSGDETRWSVTIIKKSAAGSDAILSTASSCNKKKAYLQVVETGTDCKSARLQWIPQDKVKKPTIWRIDCQQEDVFKEDYMFDYHPYACSLKAMNRQNSKCENSYITGTSICLPDSVVLSTIKGWQWHMMDGKCDCDKIRLESKSRGQMRDGGCTGELDCQYDPCAVDDCHCQCLGSCWDYSCVP